MAKRSSRKNKGSKRKSKRSKNGEVRKLLGRSWIALSALLRSGGGAHEDKRAKKISKQNRRDALADAG